MNKLIFAFACTQNYINKANPFLISVNKYSNADETILINLVDDASKIDDLPNYDGIDNHVLLKSQTINLTSINCLQHGEFLKTNYFCSKKHVPSVLPNDIVLFTDMDMVMQRPFLAHELALLKNLPEGTVCVGANNGPNDNLFNEGVRLSWNKSRVLETLGESDGLLRIKRCYNTGVIATSVSTWERINQIYDVCFPSLEGLFKHYAMQQWIISYILSFPEFKVFDMPHSMHTHGHYDLPLGTTKDEESKIFFNNQLILFKHKL